MDLGVFDRHINSTFKDLLDASSNLCGDFDLDPTSEPGDSCYLYTEENQDCKSALRDTTREALRLPDIDVSRSYQPGIDGSNSYLPNIDVTNSYLPDVDLSNSYLSTKRRQNKANEATSLEIPASHPAVIKLPELAWNKSNNNAPFRSCSSRCLDFRLPSRDDEEFLQNSDSDFEDDQLPNLNNHGMRNKDAASANQNFNFSQELSAVKSPSLIRVASRIYSVGLGLRNKSSWVDPMFVEENVETVPTGNRVWQDILKELGSTELKDIPKVDNRKTGTSGYNLKDYVPTAPQHQKPVKDSIKKWNEYRMRRVSIRSAAKSLGTTTTNTRTSSYDDSSLGDQQSLSSIYRESLAEMRRLADTRRISFTLNRDNNIIKRYPDMFPYIPELYNRAKECIRFDLPCNLRVLHKKTPLYYLAHYTRLTADLKTLFTRAFNRYKKAKILNLYIALNDLLAKDLGVRNYEVIDRYILKHERSLRSLPVGREVKLELDEFIGMCAFCERKYRSMFQEDVHGCRTYLEYLDFEHTLVKMEGLRGLSTSMKILLVSLS